MESNKSKMLLLIALAEGIVITGLVLGMVQGWISTTAFIIAMVVISSLTALMVLLSVQSKAATNNTESRND